MRARSGGARDGGALAIRSTGVVLDDHPRLRAASVLEADLARNYADDVVLLCKFGAFRGREAIRGSAERRRFTTHGVTDQRTAMGVAATARRTPVGLATSILPGQANGPGNLPGPLA